MRTVSLSRYFDQSPALQRLKAHIEEDVFNYNGHHPRQLVEGVNTTQSLLPASPLDAKVVVFELQCPPCIRIWRSAAVRVGYYLHRFDGLVAVEKKSNLLSASMLKCHFVGNTQSRSVQIHFVYSDPTESPDSSMLRYAVQRPDMVTLAMWRSPNLREDQDYDAKYTYSTCHTPNDVLAGQANCDKDLSLDEFIAIGHLRSGGSLQWLNILHGLRCRTLNIRHPDVHKLLHVAVSQVGPLDLNTGKWIWHQELEDVSFCNALLEELEDLFLDIGTCIIDAKVMSNISRLLTRILAASPSEAISERGIALLRRVRRKTFDWVQELSYNLGQDPTIEERRTSLLSMSATCEITFDVDAATLPKHFQSAEDFGAAALIHTLFTRGLSYYYHPARLSVVLGNILGDVVLAGASDHAIDLVIRMFFPRHKPGVGRWERVHCPNTSWLTCRIRETTDRPSEIVHLNLLDGDFRVEGERVGNLERAIWDHQRSDDLQLLMSTFPANCFRSGLFVLQATESAIAPTTSRCKIHIPLRGREWTIRMWRNDSKDILEWIPSRILQDGLPPALVVGRIHWLNLTKRMIEICALERPLDQAAESWRIDCGSGRYRAYKGHETLVDIGSPTWRMVSECFKCLNVFVFRQKENDFQHKPIDLLITTFLIQLRASSALRLSVALPCHGLSFFVNEEGELESYDLKHMVLDEKPRIETLFGINLLSLRQKSALPKELFFRQIIVPNGIPKMHDRLRRRIRFELQDNERRNVVLSIKKSSSNRRSEPDACIHIYDVDTELGCLTGSGSIASTRLLADMHAATSWVMPDPLTGKTGAQASSWLLQSGACQSLEAVDAKNWNIRQQFRSTEDIPTFNDPEITHHRLLGSRPVPELPPRSVLQANSLKRSSEDIHLLNRLFPSLEMSQTYSTLQLDYIAQLRVSAQRAREEFNRIRTLRGEDRIDMLKKHYAQCRATYLDALAALKQTLGPTSPLEQALYQFGRWPSITGDSLLRCLASTSTTSLPGQWKKCLISFALILLDLQRSRRLLRFAFDGLEEEFSKEFENDGCDGWSPEEYPDWLLIQIQGNFLIRRDQADVAKEIISLKSGKNTVTQVNMGEGKSSVIIPIAAAALADGKQLARVIVPKALTSQMFEILVTRLAGLTNRPIYHIPFSRSPYLTNYNGDRQIDGLQDMMSQFLVTKRGILLMQPQHVASLKLTCIEQQIRKDISVAKSLPKVLTSLYEYFKTPLSLKLFSKNSFVGNMFRQLSQVANRSSQNVITRKYDHHGPGTVLHASENESKWLSLQKWMDSHVRDVLDESDEILHPRFQLLYTVGVERHIDGYPERWAITQEVLQLLKECAHMLAKSYPNSVEIEYGTPGPFPHVGITQGSDIGQRVTRMVVELVVAGRIPNFNFQDLSPDLRDAIRGFISDKDVLQIPDTVKKVEEHAKCSDQSCTWGGLLLLRGLFVSNIPLFAIAERRWRVNYGLLPLPVVPPFRRSTMLAVPYRSKDMPTFNTQFGHQDMTIILTCLSYYYSGLNEWELRSSFEILLNQDDPHAEYARWIKDTDVDLLPHSLRKLSEISLRSSDQWDKVIFPLFTRNQGTINFYLSRMVFPNEMKEFPWKFSVSSWDLVEKRARLITGFSGTNDCRLLLPLSIAQRDLDHQLGTNAKVLACLLRPENDFYVTTHATGKRLTTPELLRTVALQQPEIRVLLDVGAQILDCSNDQVAQTWLNIARDAAGAVYFNEQDELMILLRDGTSMPMRSSALSRQLGRCLVYLDHVHTRGTDLKLPVGSRAAVTLGPKLTKDCLVQGCMRMRKLGRGHSVMFFAPPEVDLSIRSLKKDANSQITSADILTWSIHETWADIQQWAPYWAKQGIDHKARQEAWTRFCNDGLTKEELSDVWLQPAVQSLEDLYAPRKTKPSSTLLELDPAIRQRCKNLGVVSLPSAQMDEDQEREVQQEREREREGELPPNAEPAEHFLHPGVVTFVETGITPALYSSNAFQPIFTTLEKSSAAPREADFWCPFILATQDFCTTIEPVSTRGTIDQYLRPVQWILSSERDPNVLVLISPFEANRLLPSIRESEHVHLHLYAPRTSKRMKPCDDLKLYVIPPLPSDRTPPWALIDQLNMFAGQLYLRDYPSYLRLRRFLGVPTTEESPVAARARWNMFDLFDNPEGRESIFSRSPLPFVMALLAIRTRGRPFGHTHMGKILYRQVLTKKDFDDPRSWERCLYSN